MKAVKISAIISLIILSSCEDKSIEITSEYIINDNWNEVAKAIAINRLTLKKDSVINIANVRDAELLTKLEDDSTFLYYANIITDQPSYKGLKVYFNRDNGFSWSKGGSDTPTPTRVIGDLQKGTWYKFTRLLSRRFFVYVFVDSANVTHQYEIDQSNY